MAPVVRRSIHFQTRQGPTEKRVMRRRQLYQTICRKREQRNSAYCERTGTRAGGKNGILAQCGGLGRRWTAEGKSLRPTTAHASAPRRTQDIRGRWRTEKAPITRTEDRRTDRLTPTHPGARRFSDSVGLGSVRRPQGPWAGAYSAARPCSAKNDMRNKPNKGRRGAKGVIEARTRTDCGSVTVRCGTSNIGEYWASIGQVLGRRWASSCARRASAIDPSRV